MMVDQIALARVSRLKVWCWACSWSKVVVVSVVVFSLLQIDCFVCLPAEEIVVSGRTEVHGRGIPE